VLSVFNTNRIMEEMSTARRHQDRRRRVTTSPRTATKNTPAPAAYSDQSAHHGGTGTMHSSAAALAAVGSPGSPRAPCPRSPSFTRSLSLLGIGTRLKKLKKLKKV
jgi:hypothetical protein